jgi:hypothetical protein
VAVPINIIGLWNNWDANQGDQNIHRPAVERYIHIMRTIHYAESAAVRAMSERQVAPIIFASYAMDASNNILIRTSDGRHRITAAHELGLASIMAIGGPMTQFYKDIFGI